MRHKLISEYKVILLIFIFQIEHYLSDNNLTAVLDDPRRIFNLDETAVFLNPKRDTVLAKSGSKNVQSIAACSDRECITVLSGGNGKGDLAPPLIVFKYKRLPLAILQNIPPGYAYKRTKSGWMTSESFLNYIETDFCPWIKAMNIPFPIIIFIDGHQSHLSLDLSKFCSSNGIILVALYPNATHILQPMDVGVFRSLKQRFRAARDIWAMANGINTRFGKPDFPAVLKSAVDETMANANIMPNAFRDCGTFFFIYSSKFDLRIEISLLIVIYVPLQVYTHLPVRL